MIIDAENLILGRVASFAAKQALLGNKIDIVNCEKAIITGKKETVINDYLEKYNIKSANPGKGPFWQRMPDRFFRRAIRNMVPYSKSRGREAYKRIMCHISIPEKFKNQKITEIKNANITKTKNLNYITIADLVKSLGRK
jgi:large subunit ribosomal protein L13